MSFIPSWLKAAISGAARAITAPFVEPVPKPEPTPPEPAPVPATPVGGPSIKLELRKGSGPWYEMPIPINSSEPYPAKKITRQTHWATVRLTVLSGTVTLKGISASGPNNAHISGRKSGILAAGMVEEYKLYIGPLTPGRKPGVSNEQSNYSIRTAEHGEILKLSINVEHAK